MHTDTVGQSMFDSIISYNNGEPVNSKLQSNFVDFFFYIKVKKFLLHREWS